MRWRSGTGWVLGWLAGLACGAASADEAGGPVLRLDNAHLVDVHAGSALSDKVRRNRTGGYELSDGSFQSFAPWYDSPWRELTVSFMTEIDSGLGLYWGFSSGERGAKYTIAPGMKLGFLLQDPLGAQSTLTLSGLFTLGGRLREQACIADFGEIGGVQEVNCRLAATPLPPEETLQYLFDDLPPDRGQISLTWSLQF
jgi:hypothetical protein